MKNLHCNIFKASIFRKQLKCDKIYVKSTNFIGGFPNWYVACATEIHIFGNE